MALVPAGLLTHDGMETIARALEGVARKKELVTARSAYAIFMKESMSKDNKNRCKSIKEAGALWKTMSAKQKEPYAKQFNDQKVAADAVKKEWGQTFEKHWSALEKHLEAEEQVAKDNSKRKYRNLVESKKMEKKVKADRKKHLAAEKKRRAAMRQGRVARVESSRKSSATRIAELSRGLDTSLWEVRESTSRPGFFYYLNKRTRQSSAERPSSRGARAGKGQAGVRRR